MKFKTTILVLVLWAVSGTLPAQSFRPDWKTYPYEKFFFTIESPVYLDGEEDKEGWGLNLMGGDKKFGVVICVGDDLREVNLKAMSDKLLEAFEKVIKRKFHKKSEKKVLCSGFPALRVDGTYLDPNGKMKSVVSLTIASGNRFWSIIIGHDAQVSSMGLMADRMLGSIRMSKPPE